jgi:hypothetical protein
MIGMNMAFDAMATPVAGSAHKLKYSLFYGAKGTSRGL